MHGDVHGLFQFGEAGVFHAVVDGHGQHCEGGLLERAFRGAVEGARALVFQAGQHHEAGAPVHVRG